MNNSNRIGISPLGLKDGFMACCSNHLTFQPFNLSTRFQN